MERRKDQRRQEVKESKWERSGGGGEEGGRRNYCKRKGGEAQRKSISVTPVSPMLVGLPVGVNKIKHPRWLK